jgi:hypothetical protein
MAINPLLQRRIRRLHAEESLSLGVFAHRFGVKVPNIRDILAGRTWAHVAAA